MTNINKKEKGEVERAGEAMETRKSMLGSLHEPVRPPGTLGLVALLTTR